LSGIKKDLFIFCDYDEKTFESFKGIKVSYLGSKTEEVIDVIQTGDVENDLITIREKYKGHSIFRSSSIDNYIMDLR
jgi:hypothetical protein